MFLPFTQYACIILADTGVDSSVEDDGCVCLSTLFLLVKCLPSFVVLPLINTMSSGNNSAVVYNFIGGYHS